MKLKRRVDSTPPLLLTPLIDMIFLVVIFFMINAGLSINPSIKVTLPQAASGEASLDKEIIVTITASGGIYIEEEIISPGNLGEALKSKMKETGKEMVFFQGDEELAYKKLIEVMDTARLSGIKGVSLLTARKPAAP